MKRLAVLISHAGRGINLQGIIDAIETKKLPMQLMVVVSDAEDAYGLQRAQQHNIPTVIYHAKEDSLEKILVDRYPVDLVILTGWKKIISDDFIAHFSNKILNVHPGLIPDTIDGVIKNPDGTHALWNKGKFAEKAIAEFLAKATYAGSSVHFLTNEFDFGPVLERSFEKIQPDDTVESLYMRLKAKERDMLVRALVAIA